MAAERGGKGGQPEPKGRWISAQTFLDRVAAYEDSQMPGGSAEIAGIMRQRPTRRDPRRRSRAEAPKQ